MYVQMYAVDVAPDDGEVGDRRLGAADEGAAALLDEELELVKGEKVLAIAHVHAFCPATFWHPGKAQDVVLARRTMWSFLFSGMIPTRGFPHLVGCTTMARRGEGRKGRHTEGASSLVHFSSAALNSSAVGWGAYPSQG